MAQYQRDLIANAVNFIKPGGVLIYSTCTIDPMENEENVAWFLREYPEFELEPAENYVPAEVCKDGMMKIFPHIHGTDGAFAARLKRKL
jgi:16S rRNA (cytosine967-C5)-methyltransferase